MSKLYRRDPLAAIINGNLSSGGARLPHPGELNVAGAENSVAAEPKLLFQKRVEGLVETIERQRDADFVAAGVGKGHFAGAGSHS